MTEGNIPREEVLKELERIIQSEVFLSKKRGRPPLKAAALLRFLVQKRLDRKPISDAIVVREFFGAEPPKHNRRGSTDQSIARVNILMLREK